MEDGAKRNHAGGLLYQGKLLGAVGWFTEAAGDAEREREASETKASSPPLSLRYSCTYTTPSPASEATRKRYAREKAARTRKWQTGSSWKECGSAKEKGGTRKKGAKQGDKHKGRTRNETKGRREEGKGLAGKERRGKGRGREGIGGKGQEGERKGKAGEKQQLRQRRTTGPQTWVALRRVHELGAVVAGDGGLDGAHRGGVVEKRITRPKPSDR